jgi:alpha-beta hydrolase superfamily lysophospholipase
LGDAAPTPHAYPAAVYTVAEHTAGDGYRWRYRRYEPAGTPRAHVVFLHGIQSHGGWYEYSCERLRQAGYRVSFLDRRGAGLNERDRGDVSGFRRLLDDVGEFLHCQSGVQGDKETRRQGDGERVLTVLAGISWGGKVATAVLGRHPGLVDALALLCPGFYARVRPPLWRRLAIVGARLVRPRRLFPIPLNRPDLFTATPRWQHFIQSDPLGLRKATARLLVESVRLDGYVRFMAPYLDIPVLLLLAEKDRIIHNGRTRRLVESFSSTDRRIIAYAGAHHTLEFEPDRDRFIGDLCSWLDLTTGRASRGGRTV